MMKMIDIELDEQQFVQDLETISRKLASPECPSFTEEEFFVVKKLMSQKNCVLLHLDLIEQFFANSVIPVTS